MTSKSDRRISRRGFLGTMGAGAGALALNPTAALGAPKAPPTRAGERADHFGRIFRLPPFAEHDARGRGGARRARAAGRAARRRGPARGGPEGADRRPLAEREQPEQPDPHRRHHVLRAVPRPRHDLRRRVAARASRPTRRTRRNCRTPALDLDSVYGAGPVAQQELYEPDDHVKLKVESGGAVRGSAAPRRRRGDHRRPAQRREPDHPGPALRVPALPQPRRRPRRSAEQSAGPTRRLRRGAAADDLALPMAGPARVPAADRRASRWWTTSCAAGGASTSRGGRGVHAGRVPDGRLSDRDTAWCGRRTARTSPATTASRSSGFIFDPVAGRAGPIRTTSAAAPARRGGSSAGRRSSTSATAR